MILIKNLGYRDIGKKDKVGFGLYKCPYCNNIVERRYSNGKRDKSCGCQKNILSSLSNTKHGDSNKNAYHHNLFRTWSKMRDRCNRVSNQDYKYYGAKGIKLEPIWDEYINFKEWSLKNGYIRYRNLQIDRIDGDKNYGPDNCRWVTPKVNQRNRKIVILNEEKVSKIKKFFKLGLSNLFIASLYGTGYNAILNIKNNKTWKDII